MKSLEKTIKTLDTTRIELTAQMESCVDSKELDRLSREIQAIEIEISVSEERWLELNNLS